MKFNKILLSFLILFSCKTQNSFMGPDQTTTAPKPSINESDTSSDELQQGSDTEVDTTEAPGMMLYGSSYFFYMVHVIVEGSVAGGGGPSAGAKVSINITGQASASTIATANGSGQYRAEIFTYGMGIGSIHSNIIIEACAAVPGFKTRCEYNYQMQFQGYDIITSWRQNFSLTAAPPAPAPPAINSLATSTVTDSSVKVNWKSGGGNTRFFTLAHGKENQALASCSDPNSIFFAASESSHTITNLSPSSEHTVIVCATNEAGIHSPSRKITVKTRTPNPVDVTIAPNGSRALLAKWAPPADNKTYTYLVNHRQGVKMPSCKGGSPTTDTRFQLTDLNPGKPYSVIICAIHGNNQSAGAGAVVHTWSHPYELKLAIMNVDSKNLRYGVSKSPTTGTPIVPMMVCQSEGSTLSKCIKSQISVRGSSSTSIFKNLRPDTNYVLIANPGSDLQVEEKFKTKP
jgi:hypothetical protein